MQRKVLLIIIIAFGLFFIPTAHASENERICVCNTPYDCYWSILDGDIPEHVSYDAATHTLTLDNYTGYDIGFDGSDFTLELKGNNYIEEGFDTRNGSLTIKGDGSLTISEGRISIEGDCTITDNITLIINARYDGSILADKNIYINGGTITLNNGYYGMNARENIEITGGKIQITNVSERAIHTYNNLILNGGNVTIEGTNCYGLYVEKDLEINGGITKISNVKWGAYVYGKSEINNGTLEISECNQECLRLSRGLIINSGTLKVDGKKRLLDGDETEITGFLKMNGGEFIISNGAYGIEVNGNIEITGGLINIYNCQKYGLFQDVSKSSYLINRGFSDDYNISANGGKIMIDGSEQAIFFGKSFELNGSEITIKNYNLGIGNAYMNREMFQYMKLNNGSIIFLPGKEMAISIGAYVSSDYVDSDRFVFNRDNLYIKDSKYDFKYIPDNYAITIVEEINNGSEIIINAPGDVSILPKEDLNIIEGNNQKIVDTAKRIRIDADIHDFIALYINDELVDEKYYDLVEGSTIILLKDNYIKDLNEGSYSIKAVFNSGIANGNFEIVEEAPATGDNILYAVIGLIVCTIGLIFRKKIYEIL